MSLGHFRWKTRSIRFQKNCPYRQTTVKLNATLWSLLTDKMLTTKSWAIWSAGMPSLAFSRILAILDPSIEFRRFQERSRNGVTEGWLSTLKKGNKVVLLRSFQPEMRRRVKISGSDYVNLILKRSDICFETPTIL